MKINLLRNLYLAIASVLFPASLLVLSAGAAHAQKTNIRALFIGNSYTATNDLPTVTRQVAESAGDTLIPDMQAVGGYTFELHSMDPSTVSKIALGIWDYVVLQEQSQRPAFSDADVAADVYPYAKKLDSLVHEHNTCGHTVFFRTWGYRDGDPINCPSFPPICTYEGMDSLLALRYDQMAVDNQAVVSPVGDVFKEIRKIMPGIVLYQPDGSHPSEAGTYVAAVTFYTILFQKDPTLVKFNFSLPPDQADFIRTTVKILVYDNLPKYHVGEYLPDANFTASVSSSTVDFDASSSLFASNYDWDFGDGNTSILEKPTNVYSAPGTYTVRLIVDDCFTKDTTTQTVKIEPSSIAHSSLLQQTEVYPNPATQALYIKSALRSSNMQVQLLDMVGAVVADVAENSSNTGIDLSTLSSGIYFVKITDIETGAFIIRKFAKQ